MSRADKISTIIANRTPYATKAEETIEQLKKVENLLGNISSFLTKVKEKFGTDYQEKIDRLQGELAKLAGEQILERKKGLTQLYNRFKRLTLNVGVVGNARMGKSTFLQALTGLTNDEIPAAEADHCTGAPSVIINHPQTYAEVEFYDEKTFLEDVIRPFYTKLSLSPNPGSFRNFRDNPLPPLESTSANDTQLYEKLKSRHEHCSKYESLLNQSGKRIQREEFLDYIAQQKDGQKIYNWVAVKMVTIRCPFAVEDVGELSVCDTPGLGDFVCGAEDNLTQNIGNSIDSVLMLKRVPPGGIVKSEDMQLYDLIPQAIPELEVKDWSYFIVNRSGTDAELAEFQKQVTEKIKVRRVITLDARTGTEVLVEFEGILDDLVENQENLDETLYQSRLSKVQQLLHSIRQFAETEMKPFLKEYESGMMDVNTAKARFEDEIWNKLRNSLTDMRDEYQHEASKENEELKKCVQDLANKKDAPDFLLKPVKVIAEEIKADPIGWLQEEMNRLRVTLGKEIGKTVVNLALLFDKLRESVRKSFLEEGQLQAFLPETKVPSEWWDDLTKQMRSVPTPKKEVIEDIAQGIEAFQRGVTGGSHGVYYVPN